MSDGDLVTGVDATMRAVGAERAKTGMTIAEALEKCAHVVLRKAVKLVPKDTRALERSGEVIGGGKGLSATFQVVFGGPKAPYAWWVHENLEARHAPGTQAKYLEEAIRSTRGTCAAIIKREVEAGVGGVVNGMVV